MEETILTALKEAKKAGEVAAETGVDKAEVDKIIKKLVKEDKVYSPRRCYYQAK